MASGVHLWYVSKTRDLKMSYTSMNLQKKTYGKLCGVQQTRQPML